MKRHNFLGKLLLVVLLGGLIFVEPTQDIAEKLLVAEGEARTADGELSDGSDFGGRVQGNQQMAVVYGANTVRFIVDSSFTPPSGATSRAMATGPPSPALQAPLS